MILKLYCDGGVIGGRNPGDGVYWSVGKAVGEDGRDTEVVVKDASYEYHSNNEAEYLALIDAMQYAAQEFGNGYRRVIIHSDSQLIVNQYNGRWTCGQPHLQKLLATAQRNAEFLEKMGMTVEVMWVKRTVNVRRLGH